MSKKKNPKGAGRKKFEDPEMVKATLYPNVTKKAIRLHGGKSLASKKAAEYLEETAKTLE